MKVTCPKCKARLVLPDEKLKSGGMKFKCSKCGAILAYKGKVQKPAPDSASDSGPLPPQPSASEPEFSSPPVSRDQEKQPLPESSPPIAEGQPGNILREVPVAPSPEIDKKRETPKKTEAATEKSEKYTTPPAAKTGSLVSRKAILTAALAGIFVIVLAAAFFFSSQNKEIQKLASSPVPAEPAKVQPLVQNSLPQSGPSLTPAADSSLTASSPAIPSEMTDEKAIEIVKKSDALMKMTRVETIVDKWSMENAGKYTIIGWQAKKVDEQRYLVTYTARNGDKTTGFYFALDVQTGAVQDVAHNKELQTKYNIQYGN